MEIVIHNISFICIIFLQWKDLECAGLQAILIDWQGGFLGSVANDLMWALFPFLEANAQDKVKICNDLSL